MNRYSGFLWLALLLTLTGYTQTNRYIISFKNKNNSPFSLNTPLSYLSQKSIDRRIRYQIGLDSTDLPVNPAYLDSVRLSGNIVLLNKSKWLNSVSILTTDAAAITKINSFSFVKSITTIAPRMANGNSQPVKFDLEDQPLPLQSFREMGTADFFNYGSSFQQVHIHNGEFLHNIGLRGQSMVIGVLDAGFQNYHTVKAFDSARANGQIMGIWDFVAFDSSVSEDNLHGMECLSTMASNIPGTFVGTAPRAGYFLFRSEDAATEFPIEEHNWVCAAERLDSVGGDLISSSLGYNTFDPPFTAFSHSYTDMNGNTTTTSIGADLAAKKGILVVNSAGNEGNNGWHFIIAPADGDSVMAVGGVSGTGAVASFSSFGPSSDGQIKPDVASVGVATTVWLPGNTLGTNNGTSFAAPNLAGLTACLWQGFREFNNMKIIDALRKSGSKASSPDDRIGYGIPDVKKAVLILLKEIFQSNVTGTNCTTSVQWTSRDVSSMEYEIERMLPGQTSFTKIYEQQGTGSVFNNKNYQFDDLLSNVQPGNVSYRIRQVIDTSAAGFMAGYMDTVTTTLTNACQAVKDSIVIFPNPVRSQLSVKIITSTPIPELALYLYNSLGQLVAVQKKNILIGSTRIELPALLLARGKYYLQVYNSDKLIAAKEIIKL